VSGVVGDSSLASAVGGAEYMIPRLVLYGVIVLLLPESRI